MDRAYKQLKKISGLSVSQNEPLKDHTTFQIGGPASLYLEVREPQALPEVLKILRTEKINYLILGGGSNLLVSDQGFKGAVIKKFPRPLSISGTAVTVDASYSLAGLIMATLDSRLTGLEFAAGVPGTVGGAIKGNAGTYGEAMDKVVKTVSYINSDLQPAILENSGCCFAYRHSIFKEHDNWLITDSVIKLEQGNIEASRRLIEERIGYRMRTQPYGKPSAGCTFKNIIYTESLAAKLKNLGWELPEKFKKYKKIPAAWLIENLDLKGRAIGQAKIADEHANYIINLGGATADQVVQLISLIKMKVRDELGIQLEEEIRYLGFEPS
ncbi:MAG: UDP-N-acetylenolpyruvoylglucosamine reductase [Parcubacteria group bacterium GW2011_GWA2_43_17]|nr:MAG: UDP-N-acetylenolpyruvoylglucosamine reductase [Parcubacteria group bacterium GW2011_GWA2_43_17]KKT94472.1 MAG: UDP-N-acetylenolpyruvoylglucosamine reductase [Parcubacteria group bacterium GW2011_GWF2_45_11]KKT96881.1 MAG: UDP-N-acetylenolpyruvoylglucosamine reductase [Parcubacteria group bacterium GW2011_GWC2_45_15]OGY93786.1 MAG: UDP-N-acetylenolpyruvoylglucosamine reductase [Candidatus Komeilibacteria bacterium RIFOXYC2_FULL_45_12]HAH04522.1 hypothetical protein [Candidatus Komeilibac